MHVYYIYYIKKSAIQPCNQVNELIANLINSKVTFHRKLQLVHCVVGLCANNSYVLHCHVALSGVNKPLIFCKYR